jgi:hypothetical protein
VPSRATANPASGPRGSPVPVCGSTLGGLAALIGNTLVTGVTTWLDGLTGVWVYWTVPALRTSTATVSPGSPSTASMVTLNVTCRVVPGAMSPSPQVIWWLADE